MRTMMSASVDVRGGRMVMMDMMRDDIRDARCGSWQLRVVCFVTFVMWGSGDGEERTQDAGAVCLDFGEFAVEDRRSNEPCGDLTAAVAVLQVCLGARARPGPA